MREVESEEKSLRPLSKEERWRFDRLQDAGYTDTQALFLALDRTVDLHDAVVLRAKTEHAFHILS